MISLLDRPYGLRYWASVALHFIGGVLALLVILPYYWVRCLVGRFAR